MKVRPSVGVLFCLVAARGVEVVFGSFFSMAISRSPEVGEADVELALEETAGFTSAPGTPEVLCKRPPAMENG